MTPKARIWRTLEDINWIDVAAAVSIAAVASAVVYAWMAG